MRIAIIHDYLAQRGGAERVVLRLATLFPGAPIYTSLYVPDRTFPEFQELEVITSTLQTTVNPDRFRQAVLHYPAAFRSMDLASFDKIVVSSSAFAHHVVHPHSLVYCHTPPRFLYDPSSYFSRPPARLLATAAFWPLRTRDRRAAMTHGVYIANSAATAHRIRKVYDRAADIVHPPLWTGHLPRQLAPLPDVPRALVVSRLLPYKRVDVAISACEFAGVPLTIVGTGPDEGRLRGLAGDNVHFAGRLPDDAMAELFSSHSVLLAPGKEDFGYGPLEANYSGRPAIAIAIAGALETVQPGRTGQLVDTWDPLSWAETLRSVLSTDWSPEVLRASTRPFSGEAFDAALSLHIENL